MWGGCGCGWKIYIIKKREGGRIIKLRENNKIVEEGIKKLKRET